MLPMTFEEVVGNFNERGLCLEAVQSYLEQGSDVDRKDPKMNWSLLHFAAEERSAEMIKLLARYGADLNALDKQGRTALHIAVDSECDSSSRNGTRPDDLPTVKALLEMGASELVRANDGRTARDIACDYGEVALYDLVSRASNA
jgi:ankyrin repeat protein